MKNILLNLYEKSLLNTDRFYFINKYLPIKIHNANVDLAKAEKKNNFTKQRTAKREIYRLEDAYKELNENDSTGETE